MEIEKWTGYKNLDIGKVKDVLDELNVALVIVKSRRKENSRKVRHKDYLTITNNKVRENEQIFKEFNENWSNTRLGFKMMFNTYDPSWMSVDTYLEKLESDCLSIYEVCIVYSNNSTNSKITYRNIER